MIRIRKLDSVNYEILEFFDNMVKDLKIKLPEAK